MLIYFWINAHRLFFFGMAVYLVSLHFSVTLLLYKCSHDTEQKYTLLFVFLIFYLSLTELYSNFGRANGAQTVCQKSAMWIREHGLHTWSANYGR